MQGQAMFKICDELERLNFQLSLKRSLEFFAREGDWQTVAYASKVKSVEAWEIDPQFEPQLHKNLPMAEVHIVDSFDYAKQQKNQNKFDFIVLDNPQNCFGRELEYCEHFEALLSALPMLDESGVIVFNINRQPFDFDNSPKWQHRRSLYYNIQNTSRLNVQDFLIPFYKKLFSENSFKITFCFEMPRNDQYLSYLVFGLTST